MITIYTTPTCPYCALTKKYLKDYGIDFYEVDVSTNPQRAQEMVVISGQMGVPVITFGNQVIVGFDKEAIDDLVASQKMVVK